MRDAMTDTAIAPVPGPAPPAGRAGPRPDPARPPRAAASGLTADEVRRRLAAPFDEHEIRVKPQSVKGNRALAVFYLDARLVAARLDDVVGIDGWKVETTVLATGSVLCRLSIRFGDEWISREDVGSPSEQPDAGDREKAAFSDALKRAAVLFGVGRYLYGLPPTWADYDPVKKQFTGTVPVPVPRPRPAPRAKAERPAAAQTTEYVPPKTMPEFKQRLAEWEAEMVEHGKCGPGDLFLWIDEFRHRNNIREPDCAKWGAAVIPSLVEHARRFKPVPPKAEDGDDPPY